MGGKKKKKEQFNLCMATRKKGWCWAKAMETSTEKISRTCQQEPEHSNAKQAVGISWRGGAHLHTQGGDGENCILFLNWLHSPKLTASIVLLSDDLKRLQLSDALTGSTLAAASSCNLTSQVSKLQLGVNYSQGSEDFHDIQWLNYIKAFSWSHW